nr:MAG TPA: hypothetical protein [Caudoviricetes sp.]
MDNFRVKIHVNLNKINQIYGIFSGGLTKYKPHNLYASKVTLAAAP